jgi:23S rRNA pseudouridine2605 synthase
VRLAKYLAHAGVASRRAAERLISSGRVSVAGATELDPARDVEPSDAVAVDGVEVAGPEPRVVYALHKPIGVVSTARDTHGRPTVVELLGARDRRLYPVGRLDIDTSGLILLTNDGELAELLTHPRHEVPKTYRAVLKGGPIAARTLRTLARGVELDDGPTAPARVRLLAPGVVEIELRAGRKRQVRRMCEAIGHPVAALARIRFGPLALGRLAPGEHRRLSPREVDRLREAARAPRSDRRAAAGRADRANH